jgi:hypothetical protein
VTVFFSGSLESEPVTANGAHRLALGACLLAKPLFAAASQAFSLHPCCAPRLVPLFPCPPYLLQTTLRMWRMQSTSCSSTSAASRAAWAQRAARWAWPIRCARCAAHGRLLCTTAAAGASWRHETRAARSRSAGEPRCSAKACCLPATGERSCSRLNFLLCTCWLGNALS